MCDWGPNERVCDALGRSEMPLALAAGARLLSDRRPSARATPPTMSLPLLFSTFKISGQVFYQSALSLGLVNLKPLTPGREPRDRSDRARMGIAGG